MKKITIVMVALLMLLATSVQADLVGRWNFDEEIGASTVTDSSGNGNTGTVVGATTGVSGKFGNALSFDGGDWVVVPDSSLLEPDEVTVEAWVKRLGSPGGAIYIVSKYLPNRYGSYSSYGLYTGSGGIRFYIGYTTSWIGSPQALASAVWDGNWHHVAGTFDGTYIKLYLDGVQVDGAAETIQDIYYYGIGNLFIGSYYNGSWLAFSGTIDEVRIWSSALTASQLNDMTPPVVSISAPLEGGYYRTATLPALAYSVDEVNPYTVVEEGYSTDEGEHTVTVTATDDAGNVGSASVTYTVWCYTFVGFLPPVDNPPVVNVGKAGRTFPIKWQLKDYEGNFVSDLAVVTGLTYQQVNIDNGYIDPDPIVGDTSGSSGLRYDSASDQYIFTWQTSKDFAGKSYEFALALNDGTVHTALFKFTK